MSTSTQLINCPACGATNRVAQERRQQNLLPVCGKCGATLPDKAEPLKVTDADFQQQVLNSTTPVLLDLWAPWCGPCRMIAPVIDQLASELAGRVRIAKLNTDENPRVAAQLNVRSIPTLVIFSGGREVDRLLGVQPKQEILRRLERVL
jgi:thioredoxin 2